MSELMAHDVDRRLVSAAIHLSRIKTDLERLDRTQVLPERMESLNRLAEAIQISQWILEETRTGRVRRRAKTLADLVDIEEYKRKYMRFEEPEETQPPPRTKQQKPRTPRKT